MTTDQPLRLKAQDMQDIEVMSAVLQDAIVPLSDMSFRKEEGVFLAVVHRFCWDEQREELRGDGAIGGEMDDPGPFHRVCCAVTVKNVTAVQLRGIDQNDQSQMLDLLAVLPDEEGFQFVFAGAARIKLKVKGCAMTLADFGEPWPTRHRPHHYVL